MNGYDIALIIICFGVFGWIPILAFCQGIVNIVHSLKSLKNENYKYDVDKKILDIVNEEGED